MTHGGYINSLWVCGPSLKLCIVDIVEKTEQYHYPHSNIIVLTDDNSNPRSQPTRKNILNAMRWLVEDAHPDDALFIHCESARVLICSQLLDSCCRLGPWWKDA